MQGDTDSSPEATIYRFIRTNKDPQDHIELLTLFNNSIVSKTFNITLNVSIAQTGFIQSNIAWKDQLLALQD